MLHPLQPKTTTQDFFDLLSVDDKAYISTGIEEVIIVCHSQSLLCMLPAGWADRAVVREMSPQEMSSSYFDELVEDGRVVPLSIQTASALLAAAIRRAETNKPK